MRKDMVPAACVVYSGGLSAKGAVYSSVGGTLALKGWSLQPGGRFSLTTATGGHI